MKGIIISLLFLATVLLSGCGKKIPDNVIQPKKMESILYDYQIINAMSSQISFSDNYKKELLRQSLFEKYRITEAQFDSSMVWYTRHGAYLAEIYTNLNKRFEREKDFYAERLQLQNGEQQASLAGDTVNIWTSSTLYLLNNDPLSNRLSFSMDADTNYHAKDAFEWGIDYIFVPDREKKVTMGLSVIYENDSIIGKTVDVTTSGRNAIFLQSDSAYKVKSIHGFVYMYPVKDEKQGLFLNHISLMRYHSSNDSIPVQAESVRDVMK